jgi:hypothetical protein
LLACLPLVAFDYLFAFAYVLLENINSKICSNTEIRQTMLKKKMYKHAIELSKK